MTTPQEFPSLRSLLSGGNAHSLELRTRQLSRKVPGKLVGTNSDPPLAEQGDPTGPITHHARLWVQSAPLVKKEQSRTGRGWPYACVSS
jgi:hypothetical protein